VLLPTLGTRPLELDPVVPVTRGVRDVEPSPVVLAGRVEPPEERTVPPDERVEPPDDCTLPPDERVEPPEDCTLPPDERVEPPVDDRVEPWERDWLLPTDERVAPDVRPMLEDPPDRDGLFTVEPDEELPREPLR
jgi:hypothetical protein